MKILQTFTIFTMVLTWPLFELPASAQTAADNNSSAGRTMGVINYAEDAAAALRGVEARMPRSEAAPRGQGGGSPNLASAQSRTMADDSTKAESPKISVPSSAAEPISVEMGGGGVGLSIMGSNVKKSKSVPFNADTVIYPRTESGASTAVTVAPRADDTMIETYTIIHEASAPEEYRFRMALQPGERVVTTGENSAVVDADGITMTTIDAPWAVDAAGRPVPFFLSVEGADIVMTVHHQQGNFAYPIVVDPGLRWNCGIITCSIYFSRSVTKSMVHPANVAAALSGLCAVLSLEVPPLAATCGTLSASSWIVASKSDECEGKNQCLRVRVPGGVALMYCDGGRFCQN